MNADERVLVLERLHELEGWSEYIIEALTLNQELEPATRSMLESAVELRLLKQVRELSWSLYDTLHLITTQLELTRDEPPVLMGVSR